MTTPTHALTEQTVHVPEPPACSYDRDHNGSPPPATGIAYLAEPCMCGPTFYVCPGHWAELIQYDLEEPGLLIRACGTP